jgi:K319-like protein
MGTRHVSLTSCKAIMLAILLLSGFIAISLDRTHGVFAQQNSTSNLEETLARQLSEVFEDTAANETQPAANVSAPKSEAVGSNYFPQVDVQAPATVNQGEIVKLNGSTSSDPDGERLYYAWSQDSGIPVALNDDSQPIANFTAPKVSENSVLSFSLLVEDEKGGMGKNTTYVTVQATDKPHADAGGDQTVDEGEWVTLDGEDSSDPNGGNLEYSWIQTGGPDVDLQDTSDPQAHFWSPYVYDDEELQFSLTVRNAEGNSDEDSVSIRVNTDVDSNDQPHADAGGDQSVDEGEWVTLDGDGSYDPDGEELDYSWTQTDGPDVDLEDDDQEEAHFRAPAVSDDTSLRFELRVEDESGRSDEDSVTVNVNEYDDYNDDLPCVQTYDTAHGTYVTDCDNDNDNIPIIPPVCGPGESGPNCTPLPPLCGPGETGPNCPKPPVCNQGESGPNCTPLPPLCGPGESGPNCPKPPVCKPGQTGPNCPPAPRPPVCKPGQTGPNCPPAPKPPLCGPGESGPTCKPITQPGKIEPRPTKQDTQPKKIEPKPEKKMTKQTQKPPKKITSSEHKISKPDSKPPKPPQQKFKSSGSHGGGGSGGGGGSKLRR